MASRFLFFVVLVSLAATACSASSTSVNVVAGEAPRESAVPDAVSNDVGAFPLSEDPLAEPGNRRAQWERTGPSSYTWALEMRCFCAIDGPIQLSVIDRQPNPRQELGVQTVEQLFDIIEQSGGADSLQVAYHPDLGYPIEIRIDRYFNGSDDEIDYFVRDLKPVDGG